MTAKVDGVELGSRDEALRQVEQYVQSQADAIDLIAQHAPLDRTLECVCDLVEGAVPGARALLMTSDSDYPVRVFHEEGFPRSVIADLEPRVAGWIERAPLVPPRDERVLVDDPDGEGERVWSVPIFGLGHRPLGVLCIRRVWDEDALVAADKLVHQAGRLAQIAIEHHLAERQVIGLLAAERKQIAADLHDDPVQAVTAVSLILQRLAMEVPTEQAELLGQARASVTRAIERMRRMLFELHPAALEEEGLAVAVEVYLEETFEPLGVDWALEDHLVGEPDVHVAALAYRLIHEALSNIIAHAQASSASVELTSDAAGLTARITDDGCGFDPAAVPHNRPGHLGIHSAGDLARRASGWIDIVSAPGAGCTVSFWLPLSPVD